MNSESTASTLVNANLHASVVGTPCRAHTEIGCHRETQRRPGTEVWEVPSLSKGYRLFRASIDGLARALGLGSLDTVYIFLVDCDGAIRWRGEGAPDAEMLAALEAAMPECGSAAGDA